MRATLGRRALHPDSGRVRVVHEVGDVERVPHVGERRREGKGDGLGRERKMGRRKENGPRERVSGPRGEREKERDGLG